MIDLRKTGSARPVNPITVDRELSFYGTLWLVVVCVAAAAGVFISR
jgi:hypothetical protein